MAQARAERPAALGRRRPRVARRPGGSKPPLESMVSSILRFGVLASLPFLGGGVVLALVQARASVAPQPDLQALLTYGSPAGRPWPHSLADVLGGVAAGQPDALILFGLLLLIATPPLRVVGSALVFLRQRDYLYAGLTLFVLAMLVLSFCLGLRGS